MTLAEYLKAKNIERRDFAPLIGTSEAHLSRLCKGRSRPSAELAKKIETATAGLITFERLMLGEAAPKAAPSTPAGDGEPPREGRAA